MRKKNIRVGITGGIGAGKSAVARIFAAEGYPVLDADTLAREVVAPGTPGLVAIVREFGARALKNGALDRGWLRAEIARDPRLRLKLEAITHPLIQAESERQTQELFKQGFNLVFYEASLLFEAKSEKNMDAVICVHAPDSIRIARIVARDGRGREEAEKLLASQMPQSEKMTRSDYLILNDGSEDDLRSRALAVLDEIKIRAGL